MGSSGMAPAPTPPRPGTVPLRLVESQQSEQPHAAGWQRSETAMSEPPCGGPTLKWNIMSSSLIACGAASAGGECARGALKHHRSIRRNTGPSPPLTRHTRPLNGAGRGMTAHLGRMVVCQHITGQRPITSRRQPHLGPAAASGARFQSRHCLQRLGQEYEDIWKGFNPLVGGNFESKPWRHWRRARQPASHASRGAALKDWAQEWGKGK